RWRKSDRRTSRVDRPMVTIGDRHGLASVSCWPVPICEDLTRTKARRLLSRKRLNSRLAAHEPVWRNWYTHGTQNPPGATSCRFDSDHRHHLRAMQLSDFDFVLPPELIAQHPAAQRGASRLLAVQAGQPPRDRRFDELPALLEPGDLLVLNDTRVI